MQWECNLYRGILADHPEMQLHPIVQHSPLNTRDALYGIRTEAMRLHHKAGDREIVQYVDVMSLYPYVCKYFKFPIGHPVTHVGDACQDMQAMLLKDGLMKCSIIPPGVYSIPLSRFAVISACYSACAGPVPWNRIEPRTARTKRLPKGR